MITTRELVLDTETTGLSPNSGDKIVEIGIVELLNNIPSGKHFHKYINPERSMPDSAFRVHGLSYEFLKNKPLFLDIADELLNFIGQDTIIIHNASFDLGFLNSELSSVGKRKISVSQTIDSLALAREKFPGSPASLDALCRRFSINNSDRELHGALLDSYILADVYLELTGGRQPNFELLNDKKSNAKFIGSNNFDANKTFTRTKPLKNRLSIKEIDEHKKLIKKITGLKKWLIYN